MKIIGITGSSGSGKTAAGKILEEKENIKIVDADKVVREMSKIGTRFLSAIYDTFGKDVFLEDGNLDRKKLADKIYNDKESCENLNKITFKFVVEEIIFRIEKIKRESKDVDYIVLDAPILLESGLYKYCDYIISLIADKNLKIKRICKRDNIDESTAKKRLKIQKEDEYYIKNSNFVIENKENCNLKQEVEKIFEEINKND